MTTPEPTVDRSDWYVQVTAPGVPYSAIRVAFNREAVADAVLMCKYLAQEWRKAFTDGGHASEPDEDGITREPIIAPTGADSSTPVPVAGALAYCPQHDMAPMRLSAAQFNKDGDKLYHALPESQWTKDARGADVKNHTLYWRLTVDANGESNSGKAMPALVGASR